MLVVMPASAYTSAAVFSRGLSHFQEVAGIPSSITHKSAVSAQADVRPLPTAPPRTTRETFKQDPLSTATMASTARTASAAKDRAAMARSSSTRASSSLSAVETKAGMRCALGWSRLACVLSAAAGVGSGVLGGIFSGFWVNPTNPRPWRRNSGRLFKNSAGRMPTTLDKLSSWVMMYFAQSSVTGISPPFARRMTSIDLATAESWSANTTFPFCTARPFCWSKKSPIPLNPAFTTASSSDDPCLKLYMRVNSSTASVEVPTSWATWVEIDLIALILWLFGNHGGVPGRRALVTLSRKILWPRSLAAKLRAGAQRSCLP
mmetsp:Transcript_50479/g.110397  ORF Transcript_50479/g.110397 Transcript_50479/m.110397 type:complete len:319 (-) Transcript_50479:47-1003(-)